MKYKAIIELDENRESCLDCPLRDISSDNCVLQPDNQNVHSWDEQLSKCPLKEARKSE